MASDAPKRLRKRLLQLTEQCVGLLEQYAATEDSSFRSLVTLHNLAERLGTLGPACLSDFVAVELFGPLATFGGIVPGVIDSILGDAQRTRTRVFVFAETLRALYDKLRETSSIAQHALELAAAATPLEVFAARTVDEPQSTLDLVAFCDAWAACASADLAHKEEILAALPALSKLDALRGSVEGDEAIEIQRSLHACAAAWIARAGSSAGTVGQLNDTEGSSALALRRGAFPLRRYACERWLAADSSLWRFQGRSLPPPPNDDELIER